MPSAAYLKALQAWAMEELNLDPMAAKQMAFSMAEKQKKQTAKVGEIRQRSTGLYKKVGPDKWEKISAEGGAVSSGGSGSKGSNIKRWAKEGDGDLTAPQLQKVQRSAPGKVQAKKPGAVQPEVSEGDAPSAASNKAREISSRTKAARDRVGKNVLDFSDRSELSDDEREVVDSITLFSNGDVSAVRDPSKTRESHVQVQGLRTAGGGGDYYRVDSTRQNYEVANRVMKDLASSPARDAPEVFRGMGLSDSAVSKMKVGQSFDLGDVSSWSSDEGVAHEFAADNRGQGRQVIFRMRPKRGTDISALSNYENEKEFVTGGKVRITGGAIDSQGRYVFEVTQ